MSSDHRRSRLRPRLAIALTALAMAIGGIGASPFAPGISYRMRLVTSMPSMPGMNMQGDIVLVGHGVSTGPRGRLDIDSADAGPVNGPFGPGDYILTLDSGRVIAVNPASKTYLDGFSASTASLPPQVMAQAALSNVSVNVESLGAGEPVDGRATQKFRLVAQYTLLIMGQSLSMANESVIATAQLPTPINTPFAGTLPRSMATGPFAELYAKMSDAQKQLSGTPVKVTTTTTVNGPMSMTVTQSMQISDVKPADVDDKLLQIPDGYTPKPPTP